MSKDKALAKTLRQVADQIDPPKKRTPEDNRRIADEMRRLIPELREDRKNLPHGI